MTTSSPTCPDCAAPLPPDSPQSLCPACLMRQALASRTLVDGDPAPVSPPLTPDELAERFPGFDVLECLGRGGMGVVYKARQKSLDRIVAIKILPPERVGEAKFAERFAIEAATLAKLSHPNIVTVHDFGETGGLFYIVMEYIDGVNLRDLLREGKLEAQQALAIIPPICDALQYAHDKGIVHRDIKPENLLLDRDGRVKIADFGIARLIEPVAAVCDRRIPPHENQRPTQSDAAIHAGTQGYSAPEQANGTADHRADIYALGVVLYEMLTGERPGKEVIAPSRKVRIDVRLDEMVLRALEKTPELRYQTAGEFRTVVEGISRPMDDPSIIRVKTSIKGVLLLHAGLCVLLIGLVGFVMPPWTRMMGDFQAPLPTLSRWLMDLGLSRMGLLLSILLVLDAGVLFVASRSRRRRCLRPCSAAFLIVWLVIFSFLGVGLLMPAGRWIDSVREHLPDDSARQPPHEKQDGAVYDGSRIRYRFLPGPNGEVILPMDFELARNRATEIARRFHPDFEITLDGDRFVMQRNLREYDVHNPSKSGDVSVETRKETGPAADGFRLVLEPLVEAPVSQAFQADGPQILDRPYWKSYVDQRFDPEKRSGVAMYFDFGPAVDEEFKQAMLGLLAEEEAR